MIPRDISQECAFASLRRASRAVGHLYDLVDTPTRLKVTQLTMLRSIADAGEIAHCDLARQAIGSEETFSRRLASARKQGWVSMRCTAVVEHRSWSRSIPITVWGTAAPRM